MKILYKILLRLQKKVRDARVTQLKKSLKSCGTNVFIDSSCLILPPAGLVIGDNSSISAFTTIYAQYAVTIGDNCLVSSNCGISSYNHIQSSNNRRRDEDQDHKFSKSVSIGNNVWIGMNASILPGVKIGDNSIVGSGSVVTRNIPPNEIWAGNPARSIKVLETMQSRKIND